MMKFLIVLIILMNCLVKLPRQISCAKEISEHRPRPFNRLRTFAIHSLKTLSNLRKAYELQQQKLKEAIENRELTRKMKEEMERKRLQQLYRHRDFFKSIFQRNRI
jgi:hypothetical protein